MSTLITVPFHRDKLFLVEHNGEPYTPMKPLVEGMGLAWQSQHRKLVSNGKRWGITEMVIPSVGGDQETMCMPLRKLPGWLMTIHPGKVREEIREKIVMYQDECDDALWAYWTKGKAEKADEDGEPSTVLERTPLYLDAAQTVIRHRIWFPAVYRAINEFAGAKGFRYMTKQQVRIAKPFARRVANGTATPEDWQLLDSQRKALGHTNIQPELDGFGPPALK